MTEHLIRRAASLSPCGGCGQPILAAMTSGLVVCANPEALTIHAEIAVRLAGLNVFDVIMWGLPRRMYLEWRDYGRVMAGRSHMVVSEHRCAQGARPAANTAAGMELTAPWKRKELKPAARKNIHVREGLEECPF